MSLRGVLNVKKVRRSRDILEAKCSGSIDVVQSRINLSNKLLEPLKEELLDKMFVMEASLRLVEYDEEYSERLEIVSCTENMDFRRM
ncbi:hypothetical protein A2U01_0051713 [Trifolium medium]|uniref:Uncharacterized protein n=1 Tax=Trifolium medium TaxID=97028 RepID=A0A392R330_9FABA|nr:hypothetical protein [Trifolium medium]